MAEESRIDAGRKRERDKKNVNKVNEVERERRKRANHGESCDYRRLRGIVNDGMEETGDCGGG